MQRCFLAAEAGEPVSPALRSALVAAEGLAWADPGLRAHEGRNSRLVLDSARSSVAKAVGVPAAVVNFTPGRDAALLETAMRVGSPGPLVAGAAERRVVLRAAEARSESPQAHIVPVDGVGRIVEQKFVDSLEGASAALLQVGNQEVGTVQPVEVVYNRCAELGIPLVVDATMAAGRSPLPPQWDVLVLDARTWGGGDDVGVIVRKPGTAWQGAGPTSAPQRGEVGVPRCAAAALTLETALRSAPATADTQRSLTDRLRAGLAAMPDVAVHGDPVLRLPHIVGFSALYIDAEALLLELDRIGISVSSGSACVSDDESPSHVLAAMGALTSGNVRVTLPLNASPECIERLLEALPPVLHDMRKEAGL